MKILYFYCGEGLGHSTRTIAAGKELLKKHDVVFASYGYAKEFVEKNGLKVEEVPSEIKLVGKAGALDIQESIVNTIQKLDPMIIMKFNSLIKKHKPNLIISDSVFTPTIIARARGIPFWMVINQTNIESFFADKEIHIRWIGNAVKTFNTSSLGSVDKILIPDFAPPFTVCRQNLILNAKLAEKIVYLGPLVRKNKADFAKTREKKKIYSSIGGFGYREKMLDKIMGVAKKMKGYKFELVCGPNAGKKKAGKNVKVHSVLADPFKTMAESQLVICGGGHSTIMESVCLGKPVLSMPDAFHSEQEGNASELERLGLGVKIDYNTPEEMLEEIIRETLADKKMKKRLAMFARLAQKLDGRKKISELVDSL